MQRGRWGWAKSRGCWIEPRAAGVHTEEGQPLLSGKQHSRAAAPAFFFARFSGCVHSNPAASRAQLHCALGPFCRRQRLGMVQTRDQYVFCHTALLHFVRQLAAERLAALEHPPQQH